MGTSVVFIPAVYTEFSYYVKREREAADEALRSFHEVPSEAQKP
ncbi:hypothetical protein PHPALM_29972, partial [Phytophthora palmivora]